MEESSDEGGGEDCVGIGTNEGGGENSEDCDGMRLDEITWENPDEGREEKTRNSTASEGSEIGRGRENTGI